MHFFMRFVVTGGAGFVGSHLCEELLRRGHQVHVLDSLITGTRKNIEHLMSNPNFTFVQHNVVEFIQVDGPVDWVLHLASPASPADYMRLQIHTLKVGALGTHNALGLAKAKGAGFLLASTSEVYGDPLEHPQKETYWGRVNPVGPRGVYDEAKRFAEAMVMAYHRTHRLDTRIARIFNTYGPRMRPNDGRAVCTFITQALRGEDLTIHGDGRQTRSFCYVSDLVDGLYRLIMSKETDPVNLGNPEEVSVLQLANEILALTGSRSRLKFLPALPDDPRQRRPDITKARQILGWEPRVPRLEGLRRTIEYFRTVCAS